MGGEIRKIERGQLWDNFVTTSDNKKESLQPRSRDQELASDWRLSCNDLTGKKEIQCTWLHEVDLALSLRCADRCRLRAPPPQQTWKQQWNFDIIVPSATCYNPTHPCTARPLHSPAYKGSDSGDGVVPLYTYPGICLSLGRQIGSKKLWHTLDIMIGPYLATSVKRRHPQAPRAKNP